MTTDKETPSESLETWLSAKPYWEQLVWKLNLEKETLTPDDLRLLYQYLSEHLGLIGRLPGARPPISFKEAIGSLQEETPASPTSLRLREIKSFVDVNALSPACSLKFGPNLTLVYGANATGKSGIARLLSNACFSRGERDILPDARAPGASAPKARASFVVEESGAERTIDYRLGDDVAVLRRFSIFDSKSVLIHLDESNQVFFTPAQIKIFDKVADTVTRLEEMLAAEESGRRRPNPFESIFSDDPTSSTAVFCAGINAKTTEIELLRQIAFDAASGDVEIETLQAEIAELRRLDIPQRRSQLSTEMENLRALRAVLQAVVERFTEKAVEDANELSASIAERETVLQALSAESFDDGVLTSIGSEQWRGLILAAKQVHDLEKNHAPAHSRCVLCHQDLSPEATRLTEKYWELLESKAEVELAGLLKRRDALVQNLKLLKVTYPRFLPTDAGVRAVGDDDAGYLEALATDFAALETILDRWLSAIAEGREVGRDGVPKVDLARLEELIAAKGEREKALGDPSGRIAMLTAQATSLRHRRLAAALKSAALEHLAFLGWSSKSTAISFPGIKRAITKRRTDAVLVGISRNYKGLFNQELARLGCRFDLVMLTSGEQGSTVREYRFDCAEEYSPSQILSEGEQNACSLADFLTEVQLDQNNAGIILDDPVTSLDHQRKDKIAERLAEEASRRQVGVFTHDVMFMSQLVRHADRLGVAVSTHWVRSVNGVPGVIEENTSPRLASVASLKRDSEDAVRNFASLGAKEQEHALGVAFDYLRSACEALIEEVLFAGTIERYDDHIRVMNLEEAVFDREAALKVVDLHGRLSEVLLAHNRSGTKGENPPSLGDLAALRKGFDELEADLKELSRAAKKERGARRASTSEKRLGW